MKRSLQSPPPTFRFCRLPRHEKYLARRIFRAKKRRGVIIIPCIAVDSFNTRAHTHTQREHIYISIYARERETEEEFWIERYVFVEREREKRAFTSDDAPVPVVFRRELDDAEE